MKKDKDLQRCPKCGFTGIYKRSRAYLWTEKSKAKHKYMEGSSIDKSFEKKSKIYRCTRCKHEFDIPLIKEE